MRILIASLAVFFTVAAASQDYTVAGIDAADITMPVNVWGQVRNPGMHLIPWDSDLRDALSAAGGPSTG